MWQAKSRVRCCVRNHKDKAVSDELPTTWWMVVTCQACLLPNKILSRFYYVKALTWGPTLQQSSTVYTHSTRKTFHAWRLTFVGSRLKCGHGRNLSMLVSSIDNASQHISMSHIEQGGFVLLKQIWKHQSLSSEWKGQLTTTIVL